MRKRNRFVATYQWSLSCQTEAALFRKPQSSHLDATNCEYKGRVWLRKATKGRHVQPPLLLLFRGSPSSPSICTINTTSYSRDMTSITNHKRVLWHRHATTIRARPAKLEHRHQLGTVLNVTGGRYSNASTLSVQLPTRVSCYITHQEM